MASNPETIAQLIAEATGAGFRDDLLAKGQARAMVWRAGVVPPEAPQFSTLLTYDLLSYAYSLMSQGLRLLDQQAEFGAARSAFEHAATAIEAATARAPLASGREDEVLKFVEQALVYKLPWAMEAVRVRGLCGGLLASRAPRHAAEFETAGSSIGKCWLARRYRRYPISWPR